MFNCVYSQNIAKALRLASVLLHLATGSLLDLHIVYYMKIVDRGSDAAASNIPLPRRPHQGKMLSMIPNTGLYNMASTKALDASNKQQ